MDTPCVVLLGHSLLIDGVAATLTAKPGIDLVRINADCDASAQHIRSLQPALVIFELDPMRAQAFLDLLEEYPELLFVGIHPEHSRLVVFGREQPLATMQDLVEMLDDKLGQPDLETAPQHTDATSIHNAGP